MLLSFVQLVIATMKQINCKLLSHFFADIPSDYIVLWCSFKQATNYIHYTTNNAPCEDGQLLSIKSSAVHQLDNGGQNGLASLSPLSSLTVHDDYGTRMHHVHYLEAAEPSSSSGSVGTHSHQTSNYNHHHHHHHLISPNETGDSSDPSAQGECVQLINNSQTSLFYLLL